jgi:hypothetical protein
MRARSGTTALVAGIFASTIGLATPALSQTSSPPPDSAHRFSLFGGTGGALFPGLGTGLEFGVSGDFRWRPVPVPLRLSLSFSQRGANDFRTYSERGGLASLEAVMRPIPRKLGLQPYFLAGAGIGTTAGVEGWAWYYANVYGPISDPQYVRRPRNTWAFGTVGMGLDIGRAFVQVRYLNPLATQGPVVVPVNIGFRFWD